MHLNCSAGTDLHILYMYSFIDRHYIYCLSIDRHSVRSNPFTPWTVDRQLLCPWDFSGRNTRVGHHALLQGIFLTQGSNPSLLCLLHWQVGSLPLASLGNVFSGGKSGNFKRKAGNASQHCGLL